MKADSSESQSLLYRVVLNYEEQYSIWPADRELPAGWRAEGMVGREEECLSRIDQVWTDMRPLSLRKAMAAAGISSKPRL